jgi:hypothetical protein
MIQIKAQGELPPGEEDESGSGFCGIQLKRNDAIVFPCRIRGRVRKDKAPVMFTRRSGGCGSALLLKQGGELLRFLSP